MTIKTTTPSEPKYEPPADLTAALAAFQAERPRITKDASNSHFGNRYATLDQVEQVVIPLLSKHGLAWTVLPGSDEAGMTLTWQLRHISGQQLSGTWPLRDGTPQQVGSQVTYYRRYFLGSVLGVSADDDDDGNAASEQPTEPAMDWAAIREEAQSLDSVGKLRQLYNQCEQRGAPRELLAEIRALGKALQVAQGALPAGEQPDA